MTGLPCKNCSVRVILWCQTPPVKRYEQNCLSRCVEQQWSDDNMAAALQSTLTTYTSYTTGSLCIALFTQKTEKLSLPLTGFLACVNVNLSLCQMMQGRGWVSCVVV